MIVCAVDRMLKNPVSKQLSARVFVVCGKMGQVDIRVLHVCGFEPKSSFH